MLAEVSVKTLATVCMASGAGTVFAEAIPLPEGWENWPATAILGFITLAALGLLWFKLKQDAASQLAITNAQMSVATAIAELTAATRQSHQLQETSNTTMNNLSTAMMTRPCIALPSDKPK